MFVKHQMKRAGVSIGLILVLVLLTATSQALQVVAQNLLPGSEFKLNANGVPDGWTLYGDKTAGQLSLRDGALLIEDKSAQGEIGIRQTIPVQAGRTYGLQAVVKELALGSLDGAFLQLRFLPSGEYQQVGLNSSEAQERQADGWSNFVVSGIAPEGTQSAQIYLYSHAVPMPALLVRSIALVPDLIVNNSVPDPVPPQYETLKNLHLKTVLASEGKAVAAIATPNTSSYRAAAELLQKTIEARCGVRVPIVADTQIQVPLEKNVILLGNRSTNAAIRQLYDRFFALTDLKYPGAGGHEVRSVHNPFGNGCNAILVGGSDDAGVQNAARVLAQELETQPAQKGTLFVGHLMKIKLAPDLKLPVELKDFQIWEASKNYASSGYFGWNSISKRLAMYYMTGDPFQAREALRLAFPDAKAKAEIASMDGELIENKDDPLAGPYHYNATHMILFWDLVEESPVFSDAERLKVVNAFSRQLKHRVQNDGNIYGLRGPASTIGSRHGLYGALSLYTLARYFHRDDPDSPVWNQAWRGSNFYFAPLAQQDPWVFGENDNLFWYSTSIAPILTYIVLSGDRRGLESGAVKRLLRTQELLWNGRRDDANLAYTSLDYLNKTAAVTGDGRWITYRERTGLSTDIFRLGQSFWPDAGIKTAAPADLLNHWSVAYLPPAYAAARHTDFQSGESFLNASFRTAPDGQGDYLLLDGMNGEGRNPYHTFAVLEMRQNGQILLQGYNNQVQTKADGMVEPIVAKDAALLHRDVLGKTATATAEVPHAAFSSWRRTLAQRIGRYALVLDDVEFRTDSENFEARILWQRTGKSWQAQDGGAHLVQSGAAQWQRNIPMLPALEAQYASFPDTARVATLSNYDTVLLRSEKPGAWLEMPFEIKHSWHGRVWARMLDFSDRGRVKFFLDGKPLEITHDAFSPAIKWSEIDLGIHALSAGTHHLRVEVTGKNPQASDFFVGLAGIALETLGAPVEGVLVPQIASADVLNTLVKGDVAAQIWEGRAQNGRHKKFFSLVGQGSEIQPLQARRLGESAAALRLPQPALAVAGEFANSYGELIVLATDHAFGKQSSQLGATTPLLRSSQPLDFDWDFQEGALHINTAQAANVLLAVEPNTSILLDGKPLNSTLSQGMSQLALPAGRHLLVNAKLSAPALARLTRELSQYAITVPALQSKPVANLSLAKPTPIFSAKVNGEIVATAIARDGETERIFVASDNTVTELDMAGKAVRVMTTDGPVRVLHWWPQHRLLVAGCTDEKVIAFDAQGQRKWTFISQMAPEVFRAAKQYWFKTAPGHNGIHGLGSGVFLNGISQLFVGSACTLEILDEKGQLVKRLPQFWGTVALFQIVPAENGSLNLLAARSITEHPNLAVINNKTLNPSQRSFRDAPAGVTPVNGWMDQARFHIFHLDVDGDGRKEVISEITGAWNRVTVWDESGKAKYNAAFGPGDNVYRGGYDHMGIAPIRGIDIADVDGDSQPEIVVALADGLIVTLDGQCRKKWSHRLGESPSALKIVGNSIVVGCENGTLLVLDGKGATLQQENIVGRVNQLQSLAPSQFLAIGKGGIVRAFALR